MDRLQRLWVKFWGLGGDVRVRRDFWWVGFWGLGFFLGCKRGFGWGIYGNN